MGPEEFRRPDEGMQSPPGETQEGEGSTTRDISVPEPPELRKAWSGVGPMIVVGVLVLAVVVFMVARIWSW
ncbi:hypothetical protein GCM10018781_61120 [Kitasatospora indigofera]|uniref:Uncharacterized protein n=1 Tax=Kitasatospora indigofera TaxID=67307 RepID=A0A919GAB2_9ACTN|nr:DUF6480 family protein [Kitasatospora indigofera]GHH80493.1 hypothetical protein GCM10018781_61120 [Kitasatospora indigofera]